MDEAIITENVERERRRFESASLYNNLVWWATEHEYSNDELKKAFKILDEELLEDFRTEFVIKILKGNIFYRARTIDIEDYGNVDKGISYDNERFYGYDWNNSKEPPADCAPSGRTSTKGESALYIASDEITACVEVKPKIRQLVSVAKFKLTEDIDILDLSRWKRNEKLDKYDQKYDVDARRFFGTYTRIVYSPSVW